MLFQNLEIKTVTAVRYPFPPLYTTFSIQYCSNRKVFEMAGYKQFVDIQYCIKDPPMTSKSKYALARRDREVQKLKEKKPVVLTSREDFPPPKSKNLSTGAVREEATGCVNRKREKYKLPISGRERVHINTSGPVLKGSVQHKEASTQHQNEHWENGINLGNKSIILIDKDEAMRKFKYDKDPTDELIPASLSHTNGKRDAKDPLYRNRFHTNTNGPVLNINCKNLPSSSCSQGHGSLSARERIVPDNGIIWDTRTALDDVLDNVRHMRPLPNMSRAAFQEMYKPAGVQREGIVYVMAGSKAAEIGVNA